MIQKPTIVKNRPESCQYVYEGGRGRGSLLCWQNVSACACIWECFTQLVLVQVKIVVELNGLWSSFETVPATTLTKRAKLRRTWARLQVLPAASVSEAVEGAPMPDSGHCAWPRKDGCKKVQRCQTADTVHDSGKMSVERGSMEHRSQWWCERRR